MEAAPAQAVTKRTPPPRGPLTNKLLYTEGDIVIDKLCGHTLRFAAVRPPGRGAVLICTRCGAYAWDRPKDLISACVPGLAHRGSGRQQRLNRFFRGLFLATMLPYRLWTLQPARGVTAGAIHWLAQRAGWFKPSPSNLVDARPAASWNRRDYLAGLGLDWHASKELVEEARAAAAERAKKKQEERRGGLAD